MSTYQTISACIHSEKSSENLAPIAVSEEVFRAKDLTVVSHPHENNLAFERVFLDQLHIRRKI